MKKEGGIIQMNIEEHKENLKKYIEEDFAFREPIKNMSDFDKYCYNHCQDIKEVLNELEKKDKVIDMMAEYIEEYTGSCPNDMYDWQEIDCDKECEISMKKCWIEYFYNKIGGIIYEQYRYIRKNENSKRKN